MARDIQTYEVRLREELAEVTGELQGLGVHNPDNPHDWIATPEPEQSGEADPNVAADRVEDWDERRAILSQLERRYNDLNRALEKVKNGTYGVCEISGEEIEEDRLRANPAARTCKAHIEDEATLPQ